MLPSGFPFQGEKFSTMYAQNFSDSCDLCYLPVALSNPDGCSFVPWVSMLPSGFEPESKTREASMIDRTTLREQMVTLTFFII